MKHQACKTLRIEDGKIFEIEERMPREVELDVFVNGALLAKASLTPSMEREFVAGHLWYRGLIENGSQIRSLKIEGSRAWAEIGPRTDTGLSIEAARKTGEGHETDETVNAYWTVRADRILENLIATLDSDLYNKTGGTHTSSLCLANAILATAEDVGRLNTLDKAFGWGILQGLDLTSCYVVTSGRITSATIEKVSRFGVPLVASKGAVTTLAVEMAERRGMTLVGFARKTRMNVYVGEDRVTLD
ncbi:MAG TPA: formate dehydrogenase accessory sulfurtransferase FdhD [Methanothrix sp.]|nr:formate dehydrogenase accessory sulfurtransferase FdhD [Methanothrix sp.]